MDKELAKSILESTLPIAQAINTMAMLISKIKEDDIKTKFRQHVAGVLVNYGDIILDVEMAYPEFQSVEGNFIANPDKISPFNLTNELAKSILDTTFSMHAHTGALGDLIAKITDEDAKKQFREYFDGLLIHSTRLVFEIEAIYPNLKPDN
jgi:hypothetical protein